MKIDTRSLCPVCLSNIPAVKYTKGKDVFLDKKCPEHGVFTTKIAKDAERFFDKTYDVPGKPFTPLCRFDGECGRDCGWCEEHRQHICTALIEITNDCNLRCPICYFGRKDKSYISVEEYKERFEAVEKVEQNGVEVLQISGGECLLHPDFAEMLEWTLTKNVGRILVNTNGLALLEDNAVFDLIEKHRNKVEVYLQFDGFNDEVYCDLRGKALLHQKQDIINKLNDASVKICLAVTVYRNNLQDIPAILDLAMRTKHISGITFQRLTKVGSALSTKLESVMQEDILLSIEQSGLMKYKDMIPLPCSHENCTSLGFLFCQGDNVYSLGDYVDFTKCKSTIANRIAFDKTILEYMQKNVCKCFVGKVLGGSFMLDKLQEFAQGDGSCHKDMKIVRILVKNFMDMETFDFERAKKCCTGVSVGGGKIIPFCVHNALKAKFASSILGED